MSSGFTTASKMLQNEKTPSSNDDEITWEDIRTETLMFGNFAELDKSPAKKAAPKKKPKKKNPQTKLKKFFRPAKNSEGFPMKHCYYEPTVGDYIYNPPRHVEAVYNWKTPPHTISFCKFCRLKPCISDVHYGSICDLSAELNIIQCLPESTIRSKLCSFMKAIMVRYFGRKYVNALPSGGVPSCVHDDIDRLQCFNEEPETEDEEDTEHEL